MRGRPCPGRAGSSVGLALLVLLLLLAGCAAPTATPAPTAPRADTAAPAPTPSQAARPTAVPTVEPTPLPSPVPSLPPGPTTPPVVYQWGSDLWLYDGGRPRPLTDDGRSYEPQLSPDGRRVLFRRSEPPTDLSASPMSLWLLDLTSGQEQAVDLTSLPPYSATIEDQPLLLPRWPWQTEWLPDSQTVLLNTAVDFSMAGPGSSPDDDLWAIDAETGQLRSLYPRTEGYGLFTISPDGQWVLWSRPTRIEVMRLGSGVRRSLLEFPGVLTYSEYAWLPEPRWLPDSRSACVAIAPQDPMQSQTYSLWQLDARSGLAQQLGQVEGAIFAWSPSGASWSPDCRQLAFVIQVDQQSHLALAAGDGSGVQEVTRGTNPQVLGWSPDGQMVLYQDESVLYGVAAGPRPQVVRLGNVGWGATALWRDEALLVVTERGLLQVATDGSGLRALQP